MAKSTSGSGWRQKSTGFLGGIAAIALIVALVGGMAIGYAVEKSRVKTTPKTTASKTNTAKNKKKAVAPKSVRLAGTVEAVAGKSITVTTKTGAKSKFTIAANTTFVKTVSGAMSDIATDVRVLFVGAGSFTSAKAVIVLPKTAKLGTLVSAADGSTMTLKGASKKPATKITTTGATVDKTTAGTLADVTKGAKIMVQAVRTKAGAMIATEIILLSGASPFA